MYSQEEIIKAHGPYVPPSGPDPSFLNDSISTIKEFPFILKAFCAQLEPSHQNACYREGGWSYKQVIHHLADSHFQAFSRFKLALTEDNPTIKPYIQNAWADTADSVDADISSSLSILEGIHARWTILLNSMNAEDFNKTFHHPEQNRNLSLWQVLGLYAWHGRHHFTQIQRHASNMGWVKTGN